MMVAEHRQHDLAGGGLRAAAQHPVRPVPARSAMAGRFPDGFHDPDAPLSGDYLLNAVYA